MVSRKGGPVLTSEPSVGWSHTKNERITTIPKLSTTRRKHTLPPLPSRPALSSPQSSYLLPLVFCLAGRQGLC